jgi:hypothetical protein
MCRTVITGLPAPLELEQPLIYGRTAVANTPADPEASRPHAKLAPVAQRCHWRPSERLVGAPEPLIGTPGGTFSVIARYRII